MMKESSILEVDGNEIKITNPNKQMWPEAGISKLLYLQKLVALAPYLLPYCHNRYLTTIRFPGGIHGKSFYQKNAPQPLPSYVHTNLREDIAYINLDSLSTLLWLGNLAALEFHPSFDRIDSLEPPEWILDIDPSEEQEPRLMEAVALIGDTLEGLGIHSVPKTSGATGIQIIVPIQQGHTFEELRKLGLFLGTYLVKKHPALFTIERLTKNRDKKIYVDYLQHAAGKSLSAAYTPRAREHATVSTPLTWDEVRRGVDIRAFNLLTIEQRLAEKGDLIAQVKQQSLHSIIKFIT